MQRYNKIVDELKQVREEKEVTQFDLAKTLNVPESYVAKVENLESRLDIIELYDWLIALDVDLLEFFRKIGWLADDSTLPALPISGGVIENGNGVLLQLAWQGQIKTVPLEGITVEDYLDVEKVISGLYSQLNNPHTKIKNREAIYQALDYAVTRLPNLNPSDIYHHIVYRLYLREYRKTQADRSWVRAGGEAIEIFLEKHYSPILAPHDIEIKALFLHKSDKTTALKQMGIHESVGQSKLDVALYGRIGTERHIFGGIHVKASLAERVSDDVPCSEAMMRKGFVSYLFTFDAKSFPPPAGDLVNRGELGTPSSPSDKRNYIEKHGSFNACFSYNLRTVESGTNTECGRKIYVSSFKPEEDPLPSFIIKDWKEFKKVLS